MARLSLAGVAKTFLAGDREIKAVDGVDLDLGEGEVATIVGPSGSGKTTLLRIAAGLEAPDSGRVALRRAASSASYSRSRASWAR